MCNLFSVEDHNKNLSIYEKIKKNFPQMADTLTAICMICKYANDSSFDDYFEISWDHYKAACKLLGIEDNIFKDGSFFSKTRMSIYPYPDSYLNPSLYSESSSESANALQLEDEYDIDRNIFYTAKFIIEKFAKIDNLFWIRS